VSDTLTRPQLHDSLALISVKPGLKFSVATLKAVLPDIETALFFAKLYELDVQELGMLLRTLFATNSVVAALTSEGGVHSSELQDYIVELGFENLFEMGDITIGTTVPKGELLPELWAALEVDVAKSIKTVAEKLKDVVGTMPGKQGEMIFKSLMTVNAQRPTLGVHKAQIHHAPQRENLVILDVSGSMSEETIKIIVDDVVALSYMANAHLIIVSDTSTYWQPGEYSTETVLAAAEYSGTHYETLASALDRDWGVVVTIADYDSSPSARNAIAQCVGRIEQVLDISLVASPTYLAEVVGQLATEVRPLLVAEYDLTGSNW
jgi:hypothetical protein